MSAPLPEVELPRKQIEVGGTEVTIRSLSRREAVTLLKMTDEWEAEVYCVACGTDQPVEAAGAWLEATPPMPARALMDAIMELSGIATERVPDPND